MVENRIKNIISSKTMWQLKLQLNRKDLSVGLGCYGNLKFSYHGKFENLHLLLNYCRYFDKTFTEMLPKKSSSNRKKAMIIT